MESLMRRVSIQYFTIKFYYLDFILLDFLDSLEFQVAR